MAPPRLWILRQVLRSGLLTPRSLVAFVVALRVSGANLVTLLQFSAARVTPVPMLVDEQERTSFGELAEQAEQLAARLRHVHGVSCGRSVAIVGANSVMLVRCLCAVSRLGGRAILINPDLAADQIDLLLQRHGVGVVLAPHGVVDLPARSDRTLFDPTTMLAGDAATQSRLLRQASGEIVVLTGGTTGLPKAAARVASPTSVLRLFLHLIATLRLHERRAVHIAVPLFHGFGLAGLMIAMALGRSVHLRRRFDAEAAAEMIHEAEVDTILLVPTILQRLMQSNTRRLPLRCIVTGGAPLPASLAQRARPLGSSVVQPLRHQRSRTVDNRDAA